MDRFLRLQKGKELVVGEAARERAADAPGAVGLLGGVLNAAGKDAGKAGVLGLQLNGEHGADVKRAVEIQAHASSRDIMHAGMNRLKTGLGQNPDGRLPAAPVALRESAVDLGDDWSRSFLG